MRAHERERERERYGTKKGGKKEMRMEKGEGRREKEGRSRQQGILLFSVLFLFVCARCGRDDFGGRIL